MQNRLAHSQWVSCLSAGRRAYGSSAEHAEPATGKTDSEAIPSGTSTIHEGSSARGGSLGGSPQPQPWTNSVSIAHGEVHVWWLHPDKVRSCQQYARIPIGFPHRCLSVSSSMCLCPRGAAPLLNTVPRAGLYYEGLSVQVVMFTHVLLQAAEDPERLALYEALLSPEETLQLAAAPTAELRRERLLARTLARTVLGRYCHPICGRAGNDHLRPTLPSLGDALWRICSGRARCKLAHLKMPFQLHAW